MQLLQMWILLTVNMWSYHVEFCQMGRFILNGTPHDVTPVS